MASAQSLTASSTPSRGSLPGRIWRWAMSLEQHTIVMTLAFLCLFTLNFMARTDPDFWWHLRTGQLIAETGAVPYHDVFSYTALGYPWVAHEWLAELIMYALYAAGGYVANVAVFSLIVTLAYFIIYRLLRRLEIEKTLAMVLILWTAVIRLAQWAPRPQVFTFLLFAIFLYTLFVHKHRGQGHLWLLPPLMALWVNLHAGYVIGLFLIAVFFVGELLNRLTGRPAADVKQLLLVGLASAAAALVNPNTYTALIYPFTYAGSGNASMRFIAEWQSADFHDYIFLPFALGIILLMIVGSSRRLDFTETLIILALTLMALQSVRHIVLFAMATAPILALRLKDKNISLAVEVKTSSSSLTPLLNLSLLIVVPLMLLARVAMAPESQLRPTPNTHSYPADGVAYIKEHRPAGNLFNTYGWGGYLIHSLYPDYRVYIDGRADVYGDDLMEEYSEVADVRPGWREVLDRRGVSTILIEKDSSLAVLLESQPDWRIAYEGEVEKVFTRGTAP